MDEIKPVAWRSKDYSPLLEGQFAWAFTANDNDLRPDHEPLYDQQAIDTLRAEVERLRHKAEQYDSVVAAIKPADGGRYRADVISRVEAMQARAERAEAEAAILRKLVRRVVAEADWRTSSNDLWFVLVNAAREVAIDAAKQAQP